MRLTAVLVKSVYLHYLKGRLEHPAMFHRAESIVRNHGSCFETCTICPISYHLCRSLYKDEVRFVLKAALYAHNKNRCAEL